MGWSSQAVLAQLVIIEGPNDGMFVYNGTPTLGNLIASTASQAGTDAEGNFYFAGETTYVNGVSQFVALNSAGGVLSWQTASAAGGPYAIQASFTLTNLPAANTLGLSANLLWVANPVLADSLWVPSADIPVGAAPTGAETWHSLNALGYSNSWADSGVNVAGQYRLIASPPRTVEIIGDLTVGTVTDGTLIATLPANYRPTHSQLIVNLQVPSGTPTNPGNMRLSVGTDGTIKSQGLAGLAAPNRIYFHDFISLDA